MGQDGARPDEGLERFRAYLDLLGEESQEAAPETEGEAPRRRLPGLERLLSMAISSTSPGMLPGASPNTKTRISRPTPPHSPIPTPPARAPAAMAASRTIS